MRTESPDALAIKEALESHTPHGNSGTILSNIAQKFLHLSARRMPWQAVLHHFIRYPPSSGGWERQAMDLFHKNNGRIPSFAELSELACVAEAALRSQEALAPWQRGKKGEEMKLRYVKLEGELSKYRYP